MYYVRAASRPATVASIIRPCSAGWLSASQQYFSLTPVQHQPPATSQTAVFFSHNKSASATGHQPAERGQDSFCMGGPRPCPIVFFLHSTPNLKASHRCTAGASISIYLFSPAGPAVCVQCVCVCVHRCYSCITQHSHSAACCCKSCMPCHIFMHMRHALLLGDRAPDQLRKHLR
jgi:hypothetical protein